MNSRTLFAVLVISFFYTEAHSELITLTFESQCSVEKDFSAGQELYFDCSPIAITTLISGDEFIKNLEKPNQYDYVDKPVLSSEMVRIANSFEEKARTLSCKSKGAAGGGGPCKKPN